MRRTLITAFALASASVANTISLPAPAVAAEQSRVCQVENLAAFGNRVHVRCNPIAGGGLMQPPIFFAVEADSPLADKLLLLGAAAMQMNRPLQIGYEGLPGQNPAGCLVQDCRRLTSVWLVK